MIIYLVSFIRIVPNNRFTYTYKKNEQAVRKGVSQHLELIGLACLT